MGFADEPPTWGHPPDPKVQSKSFKRLQRHLQEHEDDGMYLNTEIHSNKFRVVFSKDVDICIGFALSLFA